MRSPSTSDLPISRRSLPVLGAALAIPSVMNTRTCSGASETALSIAILDPMSLPLSCECVADYGQRRYEVLIDYLENEIQKTFQAVWSHSLSEAMDDLERKVDFVIGCDSAVRTDAPGLALQLEPIAQLSDSKGSFHQRGLFVVRRESTAASVLDLNDYKLVYGSQEDSDLSKSARSLLRELDVQTTTEKVCKSSSEAVSVLLKTDPADKLAAVIDSYAAPLLSGCGIVRKDDLRIIGTSSEVPFITVFANRSTSSALLKDFKSCLLALHDTKTLRAIESSDGFRDYDAKEAH